MRAAATTCPPRALIALPGRACIIDTPGMPARPTGGGCGGELRRHRGAWQLFPLPRSRHARGPVARCAAVERGELDAAPVGEFPQAVGRSGRRRRPPRAATGAEGRGARAGQSPRAPAAGAPAWPALAIAHHAALDARLARGGQADPAAQPGQLAGQRAREAFPGGWARGNPRTCTTQYQYPRLDFSDARRELLAIAAAADPTHPLGQYLVESAQGWVLAAEAAGAPGARRRWPTCRSPCSARPTRCCQAA